MGRNRKIRRKKRLKKLGRGVLILAGVFFVAWMFYVGATWGPQSPDAAPRSTGTVADTRLVEESKKLSREFEAIAARRDPTEEDLDMLRRALAAQRDFNLAQPPAPEDRRRQDELEARLNHFLAKSVSTRSKEAETAAAELLEAGKATEAVAQMQRALELQREVNQQYGRSEFRDTPRETRLRQRVSSMAAQPLHERSVELERLATDAMDEFRWDEARRLLTEARDLQVRINEESRRSTFYDAGRQERLAAAIDSLRVGETMSEIQSLSEQAATGEENDEWERAAQLYERAMVLQNQINRDHPQSRFVSTERAAELDVARQTALSTPQAKELAKNIQDMRAALVRGDFEVARRNIESGNRLVGQLFERFPRSRHLGHDVRLELEFLSLVEGSLPDLQALLREDLREIPGQNGWQMLSQPVSQQTYSRIMNGNPSRNVGVKLPVDSVTFSQARDFCRRATWILARPVQLPNRQQFEAALGAWNPAAYAEISWHRGNSEGSSKPAASGVSNEHGFLHLIGNVRQWLSDEAEAGRAWIAGLSYEDDFPQEELFRQTARNERARTLGFRYVVGEGRPAKAEDMKS